MDFASSSEQPTLGAHTIQRAWRVASRIVAARPDLSVSWADWYDAPDHLVVSDGALGAVLHFDSDDGPTWESRTASEQALRWEDVESIKAPNRFAPVDWVAHWGQPTESPSLTAKAATYALIAYAVGVDDSGREWCARPARLVHASDESADSFDSAFALRYAFPTLASTVEWYCSHFGVYLRRAAKQGNEARWHEPLWLLTRDGEPAAVLDEAGRVHLPRLSSIGEDGPDAMSAALRSAARSASLVDVLARVAHLADLTFDGFSFDVLGALTFLSGDVVRLAEVVRGGTGTAAWILPIEGPGAPLVENGTAGGDLCDEGTRPDSSEGAVASVTKLPFDIVDAEGIWMSQYDYARRIVTLSRVEESLAANGWALSSFVRVDELSDPHGRFEVFVSNDDGIQHGSERRTGTIMKVVAQLDESGYLAAWHPDFQEYLLCEGTLWGHYFEGGILKRLREAQWLAHWTYTSRGSVARSENLRSWSEAYPEWRERGRARE